MVRSKTGKLLAGVIIAQVFLVCNLVAAASDQLLQSGKQEKSIAASKYKEQSRSRHSLLPPPQTFRSNQATFAGVGRFSQQEKLLAYDQARKQAIKELKARKQAMEKSLEWKKRHSSPAARAAQINASSGGASLKVFCNNYECQQESGWKYAGRFAWDLTKSVITFPYWATRDCLKSCGDCCSEQLKHIPIP